jgi:hypothetical protein
LVVGLDGWLETVLGVCWVGAFRWDKNQEKPVKFASKKVQFYSLKTPPHSHSQNTQEFPRKPSHQKIITTNKN